MTLSSNVWRWFARLAGLAFLSYLAFFAYSMATGKEQCAMDGS
jgi:hypothetical protein